MSIERMSIEKEVRQMHSLIDTAREGDRQVLAAREGDLQTLSALQAECAAFRARVASACEDAASAREEAAATAAANASVLEANAELMRRVEAAEAEAALLRAQMAQRPLCSPGVANTPRKGLNHLRTNRHGNRHRTSPPQDQLANELLERSPPRRRSSYHRQRRAAEHDDVSDGDDALMSNE